MRVEVRLSRREWRCRRCAGRCRQLRSGALGLPGARCQVPRARCKAHDIVLPSICRVVTRGCILSTSPLYPHRPQPQYPHMPLHAGFFSTSLLLGQVSLTCPHTAQAHGPGAGNNTWLTYNKQLQYFWLQVYTTKKLRKFPQTLIFILGNQTVTLTAY